MDNRNRSRTRGTFLTSIAIAAAGLAFNSALAESVATVNGVDIDRITFDTYLQNRAQVAVADATQEQRDAVMRELTDIYLLTTLPRADELEQDEAIKAQLELQYRAVLAQAAILIACWRNFTSFSRFHVAEQTIAIFRRHQFGC